MHKKRAILLTFDFWNKEVRSISKPFL